MDRNKTHDVQVLDCTLRDGGYINNWEFKDRTIYDVIYGLTKSRMDFVECGFLDKTGKKDNTTRFSDITYINNIIRSIECKKDKTKFLAMLELGKFDAEKLPYVEDKNAVSGIRLSFRKSADTTQVLETSKKIVEKGYSLFIQPISTGSYSDSEIVGIIDMFSKIDIFAIYIVDTHGSILPNELRRILQLYDDNIDKKIKIGFHSHNNLQLSFSLAINFIEFCKNRSGILDSSLFGIGRGAGNLGTELICEYINRKQSFSKYDESELLKIIDQYILTIKNKTPWGYSLEYFLSAKYDCHPNYAAYLLNKKNMTINTINNMLDSIKKEDRNEYNEKVIQKEYEKFQTFMRSATKKPEEIINDNILLLLPGESVADNLEKINKHIADNKNIVVSVNHVSELINANFCFFSNQKRYDHFSKDIDPKKLIVSSNIVLDERHVGGYVINYEDSKMKETNSDNSTILLLNFLVKNQVKKVYIAGFDGYVYKIRNHSYDEYIDHDRIIDKERIEETNKQISKSLEIISNKITIKFITPSIFSRTIKQKVVGVIPSRLESTRLPRKALADICGMSMIIHVMKRAKMSEVLDELYVATDSKEIYDEVVKNGGNAIMTSKSHDNGTSRLTEVAKKIDGDIYVLINGDEALLNPDHIKSAVVGLINSDAPVSLLMNKYKKESSPNDFKVVVNNNKKIMYISRSDIPSNSRSNIEFLLKAYHIMAFKKEFLEKYAQLEQTPLDKAEYHELLRVLENGYSIQGVLVDSSAISVDTEEGLEYVRSIMPKDPIFRKYSQG